MTQFGTTLGMMTYGQMYPPVETSHGQVSFYSGKDDLQMYPPWETSHSQVWYYFGRLTFGQMYPQRDILWPILVLLQAG